MPTKLSRLCQGVMEAAWLAAVCVVPIFFNIYSSRIFEPDKITILRSLALLTLGAWVIKLVEDGSNKWREQGKDGSFLQYLLTYPLIAPVIALVIVYVIATIFSVTPLISLLGSYQRLEGTYTVLSYLVIFAAIITNLHRRDQINRLITTVILASLPVSFYGILQHFQLDPIPWGGDVSVRIAANMGNSIFVAAYLIMVFPLTLYRLLETFMQILSDNRQAASTRAGSLKLIIRGTIYVFIAALDLMAIYWSGSRGPMLGLMAAIFFMILLMSIVWRKRWLTFLIIGVALFGMVFLAIFNMNNGPLEALKTAPGIGRFGKLLDPESNSALVRQYIWEGTVKLVGIHGPLKFPDGSGDRFNFLRPLIGYGPETMYVAYNQFYQPELGQVEKRNASPDRSHNETWDSIVITGLLGLFVYLAIFTSVFYFGLKWLHLVDTHRRKIFFFACLIGGGIIGSLSLIVIKGIEFLGVGLPIGMVTGIVIYLASFAFGTPSHSAENKNPYTLLLIAMFVAIVGHFVEINFGIAIVATRTLFWTYAGLMLVIGHVIPESVREVPVTEEGEFSKESVNLANEKKRTRRGASGQRKKEDNKRPFTGDQPEWVRNGLVGAIIVGIILTTLGYDYLINSARSTSIIAIIVDSITKLGNQDNAPSIGILALLMFTWVLGTLLFATQDDEQAGSDHWTSSLGMMFIVSLGIGLVFWLMHALSLALLAGYTATNQEEVLAQIINIASLLTKYYLYLFVILMTLAFILPIEWPHRTSTHPVFTLLFVPVSMISIFLLVNISNIRVIQADILFKMTDPFVKAGNWQVANYLYEHSLALSPREDHYYLLLGRNYLEQAKVTENTADQEILIQQAENDLKIAQSINPLNTDHTANLARLFDWWAGTAGDNSTRLARAQKASDYYAAAVTLSPNNSTIWDQWAELFMHTLGQPREALIRLQHALALDPSFSFTQGLLGDYYLSVANTAGDTQSRENALETAAKYYRTAADDAKSGDPISKASYLISLGNVYVILSGLDPQNVNQAELIQAISVLQEALDSGMSSSDLWQVEEAIARLYLQLGDRTNAQYFAEEALKNAPSSATNQIQELITQTVALP